MSLDAGVTKCCWKIEQQDDMYRIVCKDCGTSTAWFKDFSYVIAQWRKQILCL